MNDPNMSHNTYIDLLFHKMMEWCMNASHGRYFFDLSMCLLFNILFLHFFLFSFCLCLSYSIHTAQQLIRSDHKSYVCTHIPYNHNVQHAAIHIQFYDFFHLCVCVSFCWILCQGDYDLYVLIKHSLFDIDYGRVCRQFTIYNSESELIGQQSQWNSLLFSF